LHAGRANPREPSRAVAVPHSVPRLCRILCPDCAGFCAAPLRCRNLYRGLGVYGGSSHTSGSVKVVVGHPNRPASCYRFGVAIRGMIRCTPSIRLK